MNSAKLFDLCGPMIFLFSFYAPRSSMPAFFSAIVASEISCLPASMSSVLQSWWLRMLRLLWSAVKPSFSIAWRSLPSGYSHRNEHRAPGNAPYAQGNHRPICDSAAQDATQAQFAEHQGSGMGISFCRHQLLLPLFQETYGHNTAANKRLSPL